MVNKMTAKAAINDLGGFLFAIFKIWRWNLRGSAHCRRPWIFGFLDLSQNVDFWNLPVGFGVWGRLEWIGNGCGLQIDGFSAQTEPYGFIFDDFGNFGIVFGCLTLVPEGPGTLRECPGGPGTL